MHSVSPVHTERPPASRATLCEPLTDATPEGREIDVALLVSGAIVRAHGGTIRVTSDPRVRTTFACELPPAAAPVRGEPAPADPALGPEAVGAG